MQGTLLSNNVEMLTSLFPKFVDVDVKMVSNNVRRDRKCNHRKFGVDSIEDKIKRGCNRRFIKMVKKKMIAKDYVNG